MDRIVNMLNGIEEIIYPNTYIPIYQAITAFILGLFWGAYHTAFIWTLISYLIFEFILTIALRNRPYLYLWKFRILAIGVSLLGIIFSKFIWGNRPIFQFFNTPKPLPRKRTRSF